jgi:hypothetical protein
MYNNQVNYYIKRVFIKWQKKERKLAAASRFNFDSV